jgi:hypothetical protein
MEWSTSGAAFCWSWDIRNAEQLQPHAPEKGGVLIEAAIKENVHQSARGVPAGSEVLRQLVGDGKLTILEAEYELHTGKVIRLQSAQP